MKFWFFRNMNGSQCLLKRVDLFTHKKKDLTLTLIVFLWYCHYVYWSEDSQSRCVINQKGALHVNCAAFRAWLVTGLSYSHTIHSYLAGFFFFYSFVTAEKWTIKTWVTRNMVLEVTCMSTQKTQSLAVENHLCVEKLLIFRRWTTGIHKHVLTSHALFTPYTYLFFKKEQLVIML